MDYQDKIEQLVASIDQEIVDFKMERKKGRKPTSASSEFLTNRAQGDWAEELILTASNEQLHEYVIVRYGVSDLLMVGEEGFDEYYESYQEELELIGKRPDLLVFHKKDYKEAWGIDISHLSLELLAPIVPKAIAGLEIRSSSFIEKEYEKHSLKKVKTAKAKALELKKEILSYGDEVMNEHLYEVIQGMNEANLADRDFRVQVNPRHEDKEVVKNLLKSLKEELKQVQKRDFLSFTPKVEDLSLVYKWIQTYGVPHYYIQVFYDHVYGISFEQILETVAEAENKNIHYFIERDVKNQMKSTIKINVNDGLKLGENKKKPQHKSVQKVFKKGRVVNYVKFKGGNLQLNPKKCKKLWIK